MDPPPSPIISFFFFLIELSFTCNANQLALVKFLRSLLMVILRILKQHLMEICLSIPGYVTYKKKTLSFYHELV